MKLAWRGGGYPLWTAAALLIVGALSAPYLPLVWSAFIGGAESWDHVRSTVLGRYALNTLVLVGAASVGATVIGTMGAWFMERYNFRGQAVLEVLFIAPLALPAYVGTYTWNGIFAFGGVVHRISGVVVPFRGWWAAIFVFVFALYPYVYLTARAAFMSQSRVLFEVVASLSGASGSGTRGAHLRRLWTGVIPSIRPALVGGASLVAMEVMNAYATPVYLGVDTLSTGVFRTWFGLGDLNTATRLAAIVLGAMLLLLALEQYGRGRRRYTDGGGAPSRKTALRSWRAAWVWLALVVPALIGFVLPVVQLSGWTLNTMGTGVLTGIWQTSLRTVLLALAATTWILVVAILVNLAAYLRPGLLMSSVLRASGIGYAVPGTVVAIGVLSVFQALRLVDSRLFLFGTVGGLLFAYAARYLAVAIQPLQAGFSRQHRSTVDAARSLGNGPIRVLLRVVLPVFRPTIAGAALLVAIDVIKDLPMTLLLRPFDFNTLAVQVYRLASDERMPEAAPRALLLVGVGILTIFLIMSQNERNAE